MTLKKSPKGKSHIPNANKIFSLPLKSQKLNLHAMWPLESEALIPIIEVHLEMMIPNM